MLLSLKYHTVKKLAVKILWQSGGELQQFPNFFANFYDFHNIPYANELQFATVFATKLFTVLIHQTSLPPNFFIIW